MRNLALRIVVAIAAAIPGAAAACDPLPSTVLDGWANDDAYEIFAGRITELAMLPESLEHGIRLKRATVRVEPLASVEDGAEPASVQAQIIAEVFDPGPSANALCLYPAGHHLGDVVLVIQHRDRLLGLFDREWVGQSRFASLFDE